MKKHLLFSAALLSLSHLSWAEITAEINLLETTDIHMHITDYDYYSDKTSVTIGLSRIATLIQQARDSMPNSFLVDNGDLIQGNPLGDYMARVKGITDDVHPAYKAMNLLGYDVGNIGNHEYNFGLEFLQYATSGANFPYVSTNSFVVDGDDDPSNDKPLYNEYVIVEREITADDGSKHTIKVGFMGFVPPQIMQWDAANLTGKIYPKDIIESAKQTIEKLKQEKVDVIVAIPHSGIQTSPKEGMDENASYYLSKLEDIDAILFGHSHGIFPSEMYQDIEGADIAKGTLNGVAATMPGFWGSHLGHVKLNLKKSGDSWQVIDGSGSVIPIYKKEGKDRVALVEVDQKIQEAVKDDHLATIDYMNTDVGETTAPIHSYFALVADDPSIQIVNNAQIAYVQRITQGTEYDGIPILSAAAPFKAGGRGGSDYYTDIAQGPLKLKNVSDLYIYPNTLQVLKLTGAEVKEWLEMSSLAFNQINPDAVEHQELLNPDFRSYNFDVIDGVTYQIDLVQPPKYNLDGEMINPEASRIVNLQYQGQPIDMEQEFLVASNNYRAQGGGDFPGINDSKVVIKAPDENRIVLANYIQEQKMINPKADNNWSFVDNLGKITFITGKKAEKFADDLGFEKINDGEDGFVHMGFK